MVDTRKNVTNTRVVDSHNMYSSCLIILRKRHSLDSVLHEPCYAATTVIKQGEYFYYSTFHQKRNMFINYSL